ncbi:hypothetical protein D9619_008577 [Psilocybe cf. subviscida]|uniref:Phenol hydroxylase-like C-terminal dimerisation domain-containing protein n=1 Tax=Psilocybe cf. subviscida TaxID=2480587 RepID=A0A8H5F0U4_9AGAR|nr:hypothetical protein D9619_008577 [Psilocybe cf. subviscida]
MAIFQTFGGFTSGIGIQYEDSIITRSALQSSAQSLIVGQRILPKIFLRAADFRPVEIQDLLPSDGRFKILVFTGDSSVPSQLQKIGNITSSLENALGVIARNCGCETGQIHDLFEILGISSAGKLANALVTVSVVIEAFSESSQVMLIRALIDDVDASGKLAGGGYKNYGVGREGAMVVVLPDGYVGLRSIRAEWCLRAA